MNNFDEYFAKKREEIDEMYSSGIIDEQKRGELYNTLNECMERNREIEQYSLENKEAIKRHEKTFEKFEDVMTDLSLISKIVRFNAEQTLKEIQEKRDEY